MIKLLRGFIFSWNGFIVYILLFTVKKFRCFTPLPSFPKKLSRLPALRNKHVAKVRQITLIICAKNVKLFNRNNKQYTVLLQMA